MTPSVEIKLPATRRHRREMLLGGSALCGAVMLMALPTQAQTLPPIPDASAIKSVGGTGPVITKSVDGLTLDVDLQSTRSVINWASFHVSGNDAVNFHFGSGTDIVLNKSPTVVQVDAGGHVTGTTPTGTGGNIWFYSPAGVLISPNAVMTAGNFVFARGDGLVDMDFLTAGAPLQFLRDASDSLIQITTLTATTASISATGDVVLSADTGNIEATTVLGKGATQVTATTGSVTLDEVASTADAVTVKALGGDAKIVTSAKGATGLSISASAQATVQLAETTTSGDVVIKGDAGTTVTTAHSKGDLKIDGPTVTLTDGDAVGDVLVTATAGDAKVLGSATAGDDVEVIATGGNADAANATLTSQGAGADDGHVLIRSTDGAVFLMSGVTQGTGAKAGDVTLDAKTGVFTGGGDSSHDFVATAADGNVSVGTATAKNDVTATANGTNRSAFVTTATAGHDIKITAASVGLNSGDTDTGSIFVTATAGDATIGDHLTAGDDVEVKATGGDVSADTAILTSKGLGADDGHVTVTSNHMAKLGAGVTLGSGATAGDVVVGGQTGVSVGSGSDSSRDFVVTGPAVDLAAAHAKRDLIVTGTVSASVGAGAAGRDIKVTGPTASLTSGDTDTGGIFVTATSGAATIGDHANAGDDVVVMAAGGNVEAGNATLTSKGAGADDGRVLAKSDKLVKLGAGVTLGTGAKAGDVTADGQAGVTVGAGSDSSHDFIATSANGSVSVGSAKAKNDLTATATAANTSATVGTGAAGHDIKVTGPTASLTSGDTDTGDIVVTASAGIATIGDHANAGDDVEVVATGGNVEAGSATLTSKGAGADDGHVLAKSNKMVKLGAGVTQGAGAKAGDVTVDGDGVIVGTGSDSSQDFIATPLTGDVSVGSAHAHRDVIVSPQAGSVTGNGDFSADRDIAISTPVGSINIGSANAGDDVVMRAPLGAINATGNVRAGRDNGATPAADADGAGDALNAAHPFLDFDAAPTTIFTTVGYDVSLAAQAVHVTGSTVAGHQPSTDALGTGGPVDTTTSDVRIQTLVGPTPTVGLDPSISLGAVIATRDIQIDSYKAITTGGLQAGRDIAVLGRGGAIPGGAPGHGGDVTIGSAHGGDDVVIYSIFGHAHVLGDVTSGLSFAELAPNTDITIDGATQAADQLAIYLHYFDLDETSKPGKPTGAILIRGETVTVGGNMQAVGSGSDIALRSAGNLTVQGDAHAGANATFATDAASGATLSLNTVTAAGAVTVDGGAVPGTGNTVSANELHANGGDVNVRGHAVQLGTTTASADVIVSGDTVNMGGTDAGRDVAVSGGTITMGGTTAGRDVAVSGGSVSLGATTAGDDVVVRAGDITLHGDVSAGGGADAVGAGDALVASGGAVTLEGQTFGVGGRSDVDVKATNTVTADAGTTLTADSPSSNVRVQAPGKIFIGNAKAARDVLIDGQAEVTTGNLSADRDVGVRSTGDGADVVVGNVSAGDDVVIRGERNITTGGLTAQGADSTAIDQAGDLMFNAAKSHLGASPAGDFSITGQNVDVRSAKGSIQVAGANADTEVRIQTAEVTGGAVTTTGAVTAGENVLLDGKGVQATGPLAATQHDVAVRGREGSNVNLGDASAGDDVVIRTGGNVTTGNVGAGAVAGTDGGGFGERLAAIEGAIALEGHVYDLSGHNVDIQAGSAGTGGLSATNDVRVQAGDINVGGANAGRDVLIDGGRTVATGNLTAGRDVGVRSTGDGFDVTVGAASAGDDVVIRGSHDITTGALTAQGGDSTAADQAGDLMFGATETKLNGDLTLAGQNVDVRSTKGAIQVNGSVNADTEARFQTEVATGGSVKVADVTAGENVLLDGKGVQATGTLTATHHDVAVRGREGSDVNLNDASAGDDVVVRTSGSLTAGNVGAGGGAEGGGLGERLAAIEGAIVLEGHAYDLTGHNVDIKAGGVGTGGLSAANDVRVQAGGVDLGGASAGRDVLIDGGQSVTTGNLTAGRDVGLRSTGDGFDVAVADAAAGDDVVIRGAHNITTGKLTAHGANSAATDQAGDLMFGAAKTKLNGDLTLAGQNVDVRSTKGAIQVGGSVNADTDARFQTEVATGGSIKVADVSAGENVLLDGKGVEATAKVAASHHDVAVRGREGSGVKLADVSAGDDVVIRTSGSVTTGNDTASGGADGGGLGERLAAAEGAIVLEGHAYDLSGHNVDIKAGGVGTGGLKADKDVRVQAGGIDVGGANAGRDVLIDGGLGVKTGNLTAGRDVGVRSTGEGFDVTVADVSAGDDVVIRGKRDITAGKLTAQGADSAATDQAGDLMFGAAKTRLNGDLTLAGQNVDVRSTKGAITATGSATADSDVRFQTDALTGGSVKVADVTAGQNVLLDGSAVEATGGLVATNADVAVRARSGSAKLLGVTAGDDVAIRATGDATARAVTTQGKANTDGLADKLIADAGRLTVEGRAFDVGASDIDVVSGSTTIDNAHAAGSVRIKAGSGATLNTGSADNGEILIDSGGSASAGVLKAGGDIAVRATGGDVSVDNANAGDDVVLRASGSISAGTLIAGGGNSDGAGDLLFGANPTALGGSLNLSGGNVDVKANGSATVGTATAGADIRLQTLGAARLSGIGTAGRDILVDGASASGGDLHAGGDVALYGRNGAVTLGSATAGDDIAIRATGGVSVTGVLTATGGNDTNGVADRLIGVAGGIAVASTVFDLNGAAIDVRGADINVGGAISAAGANGNVRLQSAGALTLTGASATADLLLDAGGQVTTQALTAGRDIGVRSGGGTVTIASASAGDDIVVRSSKAITVTGALTARGEADGFGAADVIYNADTTALGATFDLTGSNVDLKSSGGSISATGAINAGADVRLQTTGAGEVTTGDIVAGRDVLLDGAAATAGAVKGGRDIAVRARAGAIALGSADTQDDLVLRATGDIKVAGTASARGGADGVGAGDRLFDTDRTKLNGDFDLAGSNVDAKSSGGAIGFTGSVSAGRNVRLQTTGGGAISLAAVEATTGDIFADGSSVSATGQLKAGGDVALRGRTGTVEVASISAGDDIAVRAAGAFKAGGALSSGSGTNANGAADRLISTSESGMILRQIDPASATAAEGFTLAGGDIDIRSGGAITLGALNAAGKSNVHLQSPGDIALGTVSADTIFARASSLHIGGVWTATSARIESTAAGGVSLGTGVTGGMELSNDQVNLINAGTLEIFAGDTSGTMRGAALQIGTLSIDVAKVKTALRLYAGSGAEVRITGIFAPSTTAANSTIVSIGANAIAGNWAPKTIKVIADNGGAIGFSTTTDGRTFNGVRAFGVVELNATTDILIGFQDFIDKLAATNAADVANVVKTFHAAQGPDGSRMLVTAGALSLRADGKVAQQDTSPLAGLTRTGIFLTGNPTAGSAELTIDGMTHSTLGTIVMPQYVELYGAMKSNTTVLANESTALSNLIVLLVKPSQYYRLNTCVIFQTGNCSPAGGPPNTNIAPDRLTALNILDRTDAAGAADPTVASATNEEIWKSPE